MQRVFTKRIACRACRSFFTITSAASKFCQNRDCVSARRKADRQARKQALLNAARSGSAAHLARALRTGD